MHVRWQSGKISLLDLWKEWPCWGIPEPKNVTSIGKASFTPVCSGRIYFTSKNKIVIWPSLQQVHVSLSSEIVLKTRENSERHSGKEKGKRILTSVHKPTDLQLTETGWKVILFAVWLLGRKHPLLYLKLLKEQRGWKLHGLCRAIPVSLSNDFICVTGVRAKFIVVQPCYTEGGSGYFCWKRNSVKLISPDLLVLALFSEIVSFMISTDDDKGLKPKGSWRLQTGSVSIPCGKWAYLLSVPKHWKIKFGRNQYMTSRGYVNWNSCEHLFSLLHEICSWVWYRRPV